MKKVLVLGSGMVGSVIAADLSVDFAVTVVDVDADSLSRFARPGDPLYGTNVSTIVANLDPNLLGREVARVIGLVDPDIVVGALPSQFGFETLRQVILAKKDYVDISFMPENPLELDSLAIEHGVTAVVDCGIMPGLGSMLAGHASMKPNCDRIGIYVGGIPQNPVPPFNYKAGFAPLDVIEEYTRPVRLVRDGKVVVEDPLSDVEPIDFWETAPDGYTVGPLLKCEAFNTDGLRTVLNLNVPNMVEKTVRWPGHADLMRVLRDEGFLADPKWLFKHWGYNAGERDFTLMRVLAEADGARLEWEMVDGYDPSPFSSMARTTAYPCATVARLILNETITDYCGVIPPETLGKDVDLLHRILAELAAKGIRVRGRIEVGFWPRPRPRIRVLNK